jgi:formylglycine-generating enzyme required for sulfatase activity
VTTATGQAKGINRADLLRTLLQSGESSLHVTAEMSGFVAPPKRKVTLKIPVLPAIGGEKAPPSPKPVPPVKPQGRQAHYYRVTERKASEILPESSGKAPLKPQWYLDAPPLNPDDIQPLPIKPPDKEPLVAWAKLWPVLCAQLSEIKRTRQPDIPRIVKILANGELLHTIPRKSRQQWAATVQILVDRPERTCLFNQDFNQLLAQLKQLRGMNGLEIQTLVGYPGRRVRVKAGGRQQTQDWRAPEAGTTVFILSDLGLLEESGIALRAWLHVGRQLRLAGCRPVAFTPLPARYLTAELVSLFDCISWDRSSDLQPVAYVAPRDKLVSTPMQQDAKGEAKALLAWLSPAVRVEPALLRAVRHHLPIQAADVGTEVAAWHHEDVVRSPIGFHFQPKTLESYRQQFAEQAKANPPLAQTIAGLIHAYHRHVFPTQRYEEVLILAQLLGNKLPDAGRQEVAVARNHMRQLFRASLEQKVAIPSLPGFIQQHYFERQHAAMLPANDFLQAIWSLRRYEQGISGEIPIPDGWDVQTVLAFLDQHGTQARAYVLFQQGMQELQIGTRQRYEMGLDDFTQGSPLAEFVASSQFMLGQYIAADGQPRNFLLPLSDVETQPLPLRDEAEQRLHIAGQELTVERFTKPAWAVAVGRSHGALTVTTQSAEGRHLWYWHPPAWDAENGMLPGFWHYLPPDAATLKPDWVAGAGRDEYGLYADVEFPSPQPLSQREGGKNITQRFRWIEPTSFQMGSPETEEGRYNNEILHPVTLTQGYWLADTACTQALWQAITGENPSQFKDPNNPVEKVSWDDIKKFLQQLNRQYPELKLRLPSEAEWENACRVGTTGAFNFEGELSLDKVNYRGTWEYKSDEWGDGALKQTAKVKSYPPNRWGLYEMHGNVWEWCQDWFSNYPAEPVVDPQGSQSGVFRVLRGGSWTDLGRYCRSAYRLHSVPAARYDGIGFRLARGLELQSVRSGASQQPIGTPASERGGHERGMDGGSMPSEKERLPPLPPMPSVQAGGGGLIQKAGKALSGLFGKKDKPKK